MTSFLKIFARNESFECYKPLELYRSQCCNYMTHEKVKKFRHICGIGNASREGLHLQQNKIHQRYNQNCDTSLRNQSERVFQCDQCRFKTAEEKYLKKHKNRVHVLPELRKYLHCDQCKFTTLYKESLMRHKIAFHSTPRETFFCDQCKFKTIYKNNLEQHKYRRHVLAKMKRYFYCDRCEFKTLNRRVLERHKNVKHISFELRKFFQCTQCDFKTTYRKFLKLHNSTAHTSSELLKYFQCDQCKFKTFYKNIFMEHKYIKHECDIRAKTVYYVKLKMPEQSTYKPALQQWIEHDHCYCSTPRQINFHLRADSKQNVL